MVDYLYKDDGKNLSNMFSLAKSDKEMKEIVMNMFLFGHPPPKDFLLRIKSLSQKE